ncbi:MAG: chromosome partitioning protein [Phycisphaerales bacterium]|jgi:chromosome partitioning protein|nr:chromosome partitioning protein [Phycisphaerales bacterium]MEA2736127.1 chromosome partitioning protein [Humisphaera sp.]
MRTIAIINQKGGCGKTTTSINLAACLARLGQKTLLVDMDPQGHCGVGLAVPEDQIERTVYDALIEESDGKPAKVSEIVWQIASDFDLAPSNIKLAAFEQVFAGRSGREDRLTSALAAANGNYKWAIIDCPPSVGLITFNALRACDEVIVPVETGFFSLHGLAKMMETLELMKERCSKDILIRVLPTLYDTRTKLAREVLSELRNKFRDYLMDSTVNFNTKLKEAASFGQPITEYDPGSRGYKDFVNLARELMGHKPVDVEPVTNEKLSRPAELVQRAKQLSQLTNFQFGRNTIPTSPAQAQPAAAAPVAADATATVEPAQQHLEQPVAPRLAIAETHASSAEARIQQKIEEFYGVKQQGDEVIFAVKFEEAKKVLIAGDFNGWSAMGTPLHTNGRPGVWTTKLPLPRGRYRYRLIVDGQWMTDPNNKYVEVNEYGEMNNIVEVD